MTKQQILEKLKGAGYEAAPHAKVSSAITVFYSSGGSRFKGERITFLKEVIAPLVDGEWRPTTAIKSSVGGVVAGGVTILTKPESDVNGSLASLDARAFAKLGKPMKFEYAGESIDSVYFDDKEVLKRSILEGIKASTILDDSLVDSFQNLYDGYGVTWGPATNDATKNKLGVYTGELLIGIVGLGNLASRSQYLTKNIFGAQKAKRFILPTDPAFSGVDSFLEMANGDLFPISSKFGVGAKASIFTNLVTKGLVKYDKMSNSKFKSFLKVIKDNNLKATDSRAIMYNYGVREVLGIAKKNIADPQKVYEQIKSGKLGSEAQLAVATAKTYKNLPSNISNFKQENMSNLFNMVLAAQINGDKASLDQMTEILAGKQYWQMNLDQQLWKTSGALKFKPVLSGSATIKLIGNKSPASDITSKQGWVNYELSSKS